MAGDASGGAARLVRPDVSAANAALRQLLLRNVAAVPGQQPLQPTDPGERRVLFTQPSWAMKKMMSCSLVQAPAGDAKA